MKMRSQLLDRRYLSGAVERESEVKRMKQRELSKKK